MFNKRAQGLPINTIILIAVGLLILVLFIVFLLGGFGSLGGAKSNPYASFSSSCQSACSTDQLSGGSGEPASFCSLNTTINGATTYCDSPSMSTYPGGHCTVGSTTYGGASGQTTCTGHP